MSHMLEIKKASGQEIPWELLLLADPSREKVADYVANGECYLALMEKQTVGACVLLMTDPATAEIMNIAVAETWQNKGLGKQLLAKVIAIAREQGIKRLLVGTGNSSLGQLAFYQKAGFRIYGVERDFFTRNYPEKIIENGIICRDMVRLDMNLTLMSPS